MQKVIKAFLVMILKGRLMIVEKQMPRLWQNGWPIGK